MGEGVVTAAPVVPRGILVQPHTLNPACADAPAPAGSTANKSFSSAATRSRSAMTSACKAPVLCISSIFLRFLLYNHRVIFLQGNAIMPCLMCKSPSSPN